MYMLYLSIYVFFKNVHQKIVLFFSTEVLHIYY